MTPDLTFAAIVLVPIVLLMVLRINAALVFLSLCLGNVLVQFVARDADDFFSLLESSNATGTIETTSNNVALILLLTPVVLTTIFMIRTVHGHGRLLLNALPAAGVGLLGALLIVPLLPAGLSHNIIDSSLLVLWLQRPKTGEGKHGKHK